MNSLRHQAQAAMRPIEEAIVHIFSSEFDRPPLVTTAHVDVERMEGYSVEMTEVVDRRKIVLSLTAVREEDMAPGWWPPGWWAVGVSVSRGSGTASYAVLTRDISHTHLLAVFSGVLSRPAIRQMLVSNLDEQMNGN